MESAGTGGTKLVFQALPVRISTHGEDGAVAGKAENHLTAIGGLAPRSNTSA
jgi:hypothetical protein